MALVGLGLGLWGTHEKFKKAFTKCILIFSSYIFLIFDLSFWFYNSSNLQSIY